MADTKIAIVGLGYVGLPLALEFGKLYSTIGYDISPKRITALQKAEDGNHEVNQQEFKTAAQLIFTTELEQLSDANVYIVTVPTPIDVHKQPDLKPLQEASRCLGALLRSGDIVVYESTVYPGAVEEVCVPLLEQTAGNLKYNEDFFVGYSPERINPGDVQRTVKDIVKITSGSTPEVAQFIDQLYQSIITAGTHLASSIQVAEAAKVIENTQRDLNIALVNELAIIFNRLNIDTQEVLAAAGTKWNFMPFKPGLVGGHCIGVDPYYLTHRAEQIGYHPEVILAGRRINDGMGTYVASQIIKNMLAKKIHVQGSNVLILGFAFKEDCSDFRNTRVIDIVDELKTYGVQVNIYDPLINHEAVQQEFGIQLLKQLEPGTFDAIVIAVAHQAFKEFTPSSIRQLGKSSHILYDVKHLFSASDVEGRL